MKTKDILTDLAIALTLLAAGFTGGYLYQQWAILERFDQTIKTDEVYYDAGNLYYIAVGDTTITKND